MRLLAVLFASGLVAVSAASAQVTGGFCPVVRSGAPQPKYVPYSLVRMNTQVQTLSNGVQITSRTETHEWRDAEGRARFETSVERNGEMQLQSVVISDPVLKTTIQLHPKSQVAQISRFVAAAPYVQRPVDKAFQEAMKAEYQARPGAQPMPQIEYKNESLGLTVIAGECAQGSRTTQIIPTGAVSNDGEIRVVSENWGSPRLGIGLRSVMDDPRSGHVVNEVTELHLEAPDPAMFQAPPDYQVFDLTRDPSKP